MGKAKRNTRRAISVRGQIYETVRRHVAGTEDSVAAYMERAVSVALLRDGAAVVTRDEWLAQLDAAERERKSVVQDVASQRFTF